MLYTFREKAILEYPKDLQVGPLSVEESVDLWAKIWLAGNPQTMTNPQTHGSTRAFKFFSAFYLLFLRSLVHFYLLFLSSIVHCCLQFSSFFSGPIIC